MSRQYVRSGMFECLRPSCWFVWKVGKVGEEELLQVGNQQQYQASEREHRRERVTRGVILYV